MWINGHLRINVRTDIKSNVTFYSVVPPMEFKVVPNLHYCKHAAMNILASAPHASVPELP